MDRYYGERKSNKPIYIAIGITVAVMFVLYQLFLKGPEVEHVQKVRSRGNDSDGQRRKL